MIVVWILLGVIVLVALGAVVSYNRFVSQKNLIKDAWANIDTELRRRYDLIPNLVETVKGYATHEREVFEEVTRARASAAGATGSPAAQAAAEGPFMAALGKLFAVAEAYPDLKANQNFLALQTELSNTEDRLQTVPALLQRQRPRVQRSRAGVPVLDHRRHVPLRARRVLRDPGVDPRGRAAAGELRRGLGGTRGPGCSVSPGCTSGSGPTCRRDAASGPTGAAEQLARQSANAGAPPSS